MVDIRAGNWEFELDVTVVDGRAWWTCPIGGERCGRVMAGLGSIGLDCMTWHVEHAHLMTRTYRRPQ